MRQTDRGRREWRALCIGGWIGITGIGCIDLGGGLALGWFYASLISALLVYAWPYRPGDDPRNEQK